MTLKIFGGILLVLSGFLTGIMFSKKLIMRRDFFKRIINFTSQLSTQLRYSTDDIFNLVSLCAENCELDFLKMTGDSGMSFNLLWNERINSIPVKAGLKNNDKKLLLEFGSQLGKTDVDGQLKHLELYETMFNKVLLQSENEIKQKSKLYKTMGFFVGTAAALMII